MLKLFKKLFSEKEAEHAAIKSTELGSWFSQKVSSAEFGLLEHHTKIRRLKEELQQKAEELRAAEIDEKKHRGVENRIRNIVIGHRNQYVSDVSQFAGKIPILDTMDHKEALVFNKELKESMDHLARRTAKSYQASQHLFFDQVQPVFACLGELNVAVKNFPTEKIESFIRIEESINNLNEEQKRKKELEKTITEKIREKTDLLNEKEERFQSLLNLKNGEEYAEYQRLQHQKEQQEQKKHAVTGEIFSFFSKLQKPLKKYERIALDTKAIKPYLENEVDAFVLDADLRIIGILQGLKGNLGQLRFDEKQTKNFVELIRKSEQGYLQDLQERLKNVQEELKKINTEIDGAVIIEKIHTIGDAIKATEQKREEIEKEIEKTRSKLEKIDMDKIKQEIIQNVKESLNINLALS